jgi:hypothetical protein
MQEGGGENLALMEKDSLPRRRPGRTRISYHKKVTRVATKGGEDSGLSKEPHPPDKCNGLHRSSTRQYIASEAVYSVGDEASSRPPQPPFREDLLFGKEVLHP